jgi:hypothetical protein
MSTGKQGCVQIQKTYAFLEKRTLPLAVSAYVIRL